MKFIYLSLLKPFIFILALVMFEGNSSHVGAYTIEINKGDSPYGPINQQQEGAQIGVGPFKTVDLREEIDMALADQGKILYEGRCTACHKFSERFVGPPLGGITEKRNPVWIMNMIINPSEMVEKDPIAKALLAEYQTPMMNMGVNEEDTRAILEFLRAHDQGKINLE